jgi:hypothetical protein
MALSWTLQFLRVSENVSKGLSKGHWFAKQQKPESCLHVCKRCACFLLQGLLEFYRLPYLPKISKPTGKPAPEVIVPEAGGSKPEAVEYEIYTLPVYIYIIIFVFKKKIFLSEPGIALSIICEITSKGVLNNLDSCSLHFPQYSFPNNFDIASYGRWRSEMWEMEMGVLFLWTYIQMRGRSRICQGRYRMLLSDAGTPGPRGTTKLQMLCKNRYSKRTTSLSQLPQYIQLH